MRYGIGQLVIPDMGSKGAGDIEQDSVISVLHLHEESAADYPIDGITLRSQVVVGCDAGSGGLPSEIELELLDGSLFKATEASSSLFDVFSPSSDESNQPATHPVAQKRLRTVSGCHYLYLDTLARKLEAIGGSQGGPIAIRKMLQIGQLLEGW